MAEPFRGRVGADGVLSRVATDGDEYTVHWGDEALAKQVGN